MVPLLQCPYNPAGTDATCVVRERYALSSSDNTYRCIVPEQAPFFKNGLKVIKHPGAAELREGRDFKLGWRYNDVAAIAASELYGVIEFINPEVLGEIEIEYATIGGNFTIGAQNKLLTYLANYLIDPASTHWESVLEKLTDYPMVDHRQHWADFVNKQYIANSINGIEQAIRARSVQSDTLSVAYLNNRITQLENIVNGSKFNEHIASLANPHKSTAAKVNALPATNAAADAFKAYASTLKELADYINAAGLTQAELDAFMLKEGDSLIGNKLVLKDGVAKLRSNGITSEISLLDGGIVVSCKGVTKVGADRLRNKVGKSAILQAGKNVLKVRSNGANPTKDDLTINNVVIIHVGNIRRYLGEIDFGNVYVTTAATTTANMTGDGTEAKKLKVDVIYPTAADAVKGIGLIVQGYGDNDAAWGTAKSLADLVSDLTGYVPVTRTINGHPLSADVILAADDFGLGNVDNTTDAEKPISTQQAALLSQYSDVVHQHTLAEVAIENASTTVTGVTLLYPDVLGAEAGAVAPAAFKAALDSLAEQARILADMIDRDSLPVNSMVGKLSVNRGSTAWSVVFDSTQTLYYDRALYDITAPTLNLSTLFGAANVANRQFYVYAKVVEAGKATYHIANAARENTDGYLLAGIFRTDDTGVVATIQDATQSFGPFNELIDHINDPNAHISAGDIKGEYGLGLVENFASENTLSPFSPFAMINEWEKPIGQTAGMDDAWKMSVEGDTVTIELNGPNVPTIHNSRIANVNMWEHQVPQANGDKIASLVVRVAVSKVPANTSDTAVTQGQMMLVGVTRSGGKDYCLAMEHLLDGGSLVDQWSLVSGTDKALVAKSTVNDKYNLIEAAANIPFTKKYTVQWITAANGQRSISIVGEFGDAKSRGDTLTGIIREANLSGNALAAFASGRFGLNHWLYQSARVSIDEVTLNISKKRFITANVLTEAMRMGTGVRAISGQLAAGANFIPLPFGCSTGFVIQSIDNWADNAGGTLNGYQLDNFTLVGNEGPGAATLGPVDSPSKEMFYQQRSAVVRMLKAGVVSEVPVTTNYLSVGFVNHIKFNIVE